MDTPIAQGIEHCPPEAGAAVRIRLGVLRESSQVLCELLFHAKQRREYGAVQKGV